MAPGDITLRAIAVLHKCPALPRIATRACDKLNSITGNGDARFWPLVTSRFARSLCCTNVLLCWAAYLREPSVLSGRRLCSTSEAPSVAAGYAAPALKEHGQPPSREIGHGAGAHRSKRILVLVLVRAVLLNTNLLQRAFWSRG